MIEYKSNIRGVAQLAARTHGVREVRGSNPRTPTQKLVERHVKRASAPSQTWFSRV